MMRLTIEDGRPTCLAECDNVGVYLDNDSLGKLAEGPEDRRARFVRALRHRGTLLFSFTNAIELSGPQGPSADAICVFLDSIGPHWVPLELNPHTIVQRELAGAAGQAAMSESFMQMYFEERVRELCPTGRELLDLSAENFFRLGSVIEWAEAHRDDIRRNAAELEQTVRHNLEQLRAECRRKRSLLDRLRVPFDERQPANFVFNQLLRVTAIEEFKAGDALDLCHAVAGIAYGSIATLDKKWKARAEKLPKPNALAKVFYSRELDELVDLLELLAGGVS